MENNKKTTTVAMFQNSKRKWPMYMKAYLPVFAFCMVLSSVIYSLLMSKQLINQHAGLWNGNYYRAKYGRKIL